jgi:HPt (histidine-containing phosphotransfer) domain-containing protein
MEYTYHEIFDSEKLEELYEGDMETVHLMFESFVHGVLPEFQKLEEYAQAENWNKVQDLAHKFLPTFAMIGLMDLHHRLRKIEDRCKAEEYKSVSVLVNDTSREIEEIRPIIEKEYEKIEAFMAN